MARNGYNQYDARQQKKDFAHTLDAANYILRKLGARFHKLRDVIDALQGASGGRQEFDLSHIRLARRLRHTGNEKTAEAYARRKVAALDQEQAKVSRRLFTIERGGGIEHRRTHYIDHLTPVANWMMQQARTSDLWAINPGEALEAFADAAIEMLPEVKNENEQENGSMPLDDALYIQRMLKQGINCVLKACERAAKNGGDDLALAERTAERLLRYARGHHNSSLEFEAEPLHFCEGSSENSQQKSEKPSLLPAALDYANRAGLPVFPVKPDKSPYTSNGFKDASKDDGTICSWWGRCKDANIGIPTGEASGWLVLDIDPRHGGDASLTALIGEHGDLPETLEARTGGDGHHIIFAYPHGSNIRNSKRLGAGIDVRGEGGYIVVAPSIHASGKTYQWLNDNKPASAPEWLLKLLAEENKARPNTLTTEPRGQEKTSVEIGRRISEGERNQTLFRIAAAIRGQGAHQDEIEASLLEINARRCVPPLSDKEVRKIVVSASKYPPNSVKAITASFT